MKLGGFLRNFKDEDVFLLSGGAAEIGEFCSELEDWSRAGPPRAELGKVARLSDGWTVQVVRSTTTQQPRFEIESETRKLAVWILSSAEARKFGAQIRGLIESPSPGHAFLDNENLTVLVSKDEY